MGLSFSAAVAAPLSCAAGPASPSSASNDTGSPPSSPTAGLADATAASETEADAELGEGGKGPEAPEALLRQFRIGRVLGEGAFGVTYACYSRATGEEMAVKVIEKAQATDGGEEEEACLLRSLLHDNIVSVFQVILDRSFVSIVMDLYSGDLIYGVDLHLQNKGQISCAQIVHISSQMAAAVQYLHWKCIMHRDIKGDNFLLDRPDIADPNCHVALGDFGTACKLGPSDRLDQQVGTRRFWAPEVIAKNYGMKADIWALGVTVYGLLTGCHPFMDEPHTEHINVQVPEGTEPACAEYLRSLLCKDEAFRISADQAASHVWHF